jgi:hypothetical protein
VSIGIAKSNGLILAAMEMLREKSVCHSRPSCTVLRSKESVVRSVSPIRDLLALLEPRSQPTTNRITWLKVVYSSYNNAKGTAFLSFVQWDLQHLNNASMHETIHKSS